MRVFVWWTATFKSRCSLVPEVVWIGCEIWLRPLFFRSIPCSCACSRAAKMLASRPVHFLRCVTMLQAWPPANHLWLQTFVASARSLMWWCGEQGKMHERVCLETRKVHKLRLRISGAVTVCLVSKLREVKFTSRQQ